MKNKLKIIVLVLLLITSYWLLAANVFAYEIEDLPGMEARGDFVLGPGKTELFLNPGQSALQEITVTNRLDETMGFKVDIEDFTGSRNPSETVVLLGDKRGPYSLRDYLRPELKEFTLKNGQRMRMLVNVAVPKDAEPGGLYGSILISTVPVPKPGEIEEGQAKSGAVLISRLGTLFFVRVAGDVKEDGLLKSFSIGEKKVFSSGPVDFQLLFENNGSVYLAPYGIIEIKNIFGSKIDEIKIDPWFAMPDSLRLREVKWSKNFLLGFYTATAKINRGYDDIIDEASVGFWFFPWKIILAGLVVVFIVLFLLKWILSNFEIKRKTTT